MKIKGPEESDSGAARVKCWRYFKGALVALMTSLTGLYLDEKVQMKEVLV